MFHAVLEAVQDDMLHPGFGRHADPDASPHAVIEASNRAYLEAYQRNAGLMMSPGHCGRAPGSVSG